MDAQVFRETEKLLHRYWKKKMRIERLRAIIQQVQDQAGEIAAELAEANPVPRVVTRYSGGPAAPTGTTKGLDTAVAKYDNLLFDLQAKYLDLRRRAWRLKLRVSQLEAEIAGVATAVDQLTEDEQKIVEYRYLYQWSNYAIGQVMSFNEKTIRKKHQKIVTTVADSLAKSQKVRKKSAICE